MLQTLLIIAAAWLVLTLAGWLMLGQLSRERRNALLPGAPVIGVAGLLVALHYTDLLAAATVGVWIVAGAAFMLAVLNFRKDRRWWVIPRSALKWTLVTVLVGGIPATVVLLPQTRSGDSRVVQVTNNNDAFYYVTIIDWEQRHRLGQAPELGPIPKSGVDPPSNLPVAGHLADHLRVGEELAQAGLNVTLGLNPVDSWYPLTALWILLLPAAGLCCARFLKMRGASGVALGALVSVATLTTFQMAAQNSDSLLGVTVGLVALAAVVQLLGRQPAYPRVLAALLLAAWVGVYPEFAPLVIPALIAACLLRRPREISNAMVNGLVLVGVSVLLSPLAWANAIRSLVFLGGIQSDRLPSGFTGATGWELINRFTGASLLGAGSHPSLLSPILVAGLAGGVIAAAALSRRRAFMLTLAASGGALAYYFDSVKHRPYTQQRVVEMWLPLLMLVAVFGYDRAYRWVRATRFGAAWPARATALAGLVLLSVTWLAVNIRTDARMPWRTSAVTRHVDPSFAQAAGWIHRVAGREGNEAMVVTGHLFDQLWITHDLRSERLVSYPELFISYQAYPRFWDSRPRRWLLVDTAALVDAPPAMVVSHNNRFRLLDLRRGHALIVCPADEFGRGNILILHTPGAYLRIRLYGFVERDTHRGRSAARAVDGTPLPRGALKPGTRYLDLAVPSTGELRRLTDGHFKFVVRRVTDAPKA